jgi:hypothetical protein
VNVFPLTVAAPNSALSADAQEGAG